MSLEAVIFDMDGVLSRTQRLHAEAQSKVLEDYDVNMSPEEITRKFAGREPGTLFREKAPEADPMKAHSKKQELLYSLVDEQGVEAVEGSKELVRDLNQEFDLGVASSSQPEFIEKVISDLGLEDCFKAVESASDVPNGKPAPDVFLEVAEKLDVKPENCLVIEDGKSGMEGAKKAGMVCIGLVNDDVAYPADETVESLEQLDIERINEIHRKNS